MFRTGHPKGKYSVFMYVHTVHMTAPYRQRLFGKSKQCTHIFEHPIDGYSFFMGHRGGTQLLQGQRHFRRGFNTNYIKVALEQVHSGHGHPDQEHPEIKRLKRDILGMDVQYQVALEQRYHRH